MEALHGRLSCLSSSNISSRLRDLANDVTSYLLWHYQVASDGASIVTIYASTRDTSILFDWVGLTFHG